ncbi:MAG TPA: DnaJ domain-containing protein [Clostridia bacterium]|nr:DnaJ domain-containing protein [Clostridia bacterium]
MRNPYEVLGIREGASADEIKRAYKELVRKYHPDQYQNNPLSDLAEEKLKEINQAYDYLMKKYRQNGNDGNYTRQEEPGYRNSREDSSRSYYDQARSYINMGNVAAAEQILNGVSSRGGEWYYLKGLIFMRRGWYNEAVTHLKTAVDMEPSNYEFRDALNRVANTNRQYQSTVYDRRGYSTGPDMCGLCQCMICTDCCCECMGGDFISCC